MSIMDKVAQKQNSTIPEEGYQTGHILNAWFLRKNTEKGEMPTIQLTIAAANSGIIRNTYSLISEKGEASKNMINILALVGYEEALECCLSPKDDDRFDEDISEALNACFGACILINNLARVDNALEFDFKAEQGAFGMMASTSSFKPAGFYAEIAKKRAEAAAKLA